MDPAANRHKRQVDRVGDKSVIVACVRWIAHLFVFWLLNPVVDPSSSHCFSATAGVLILVLFQIAK